MNTVAGTELQLPRSQGDRAASWRPEDSVNFREKLRLRMGQARRSEMGDWEKKSLESEWSRNLSLSCP